MRKLFVFVSCVLLTAAAASAQTGVTPTSNTTVLPWDDYATQELRDSWDMSQRTDVGWYTWGNDQPATNMTSRQIKTDNLGNTVFSALPSNADPSFFVLDTFSPGAALLGKNGKTFPILTNKYTRLLVRIRLANEIKPPQFGSIGTVPVMQVFWSQDTIYHDASARPNGGLYTTVNSSNQAVGIPFTALGTTPSGAMEGGHYLLVSIPLADMTALAALGTGIAKWENVNTGGVTNWGSSAFNADSLRFDPVNLTGSQSGTIDIDWVRLVAPGADAPQTVSWAGGGTYDIILSPIAGCSGDNYTVVAYSKTSGSFSFNPQMLPAGVYYVGLRDALNPNGGDTPSSRLVRACSAGAYTVVDYPTLTFSSPSSTGSTDDFATVFLNNPWDFNSVGDLDFTRNLLGPGIIAIPAERPDGTPLSNINVFFSGSEAGTPATGNVGDPELYTLYSTARGLHNRIDANRYRLFTADVGVDRARDLEQGSIGRIIWHIAGETWLNNGVQADAENVSADVALRHMQKGSSNIDTTSANYILDRVQVDMADRTALPIESDTGGSPSTTGWSNSAVQCNPSCAQSRIIPFNRVGIDNFRFDPHEFASSTNFYVQRMVLAAHQRSGSSFAITWTNAMPPGLTGVPTYGTASNWKVRLYAVPVNGSSPTIPATRNCASSPGVAITNSSTDPTLSSGAFTWSTGMTAGLTDGALYFICAGLIIPGQSSVSAFTFSQWPIVYTMSAPSLPRINLDRSTIYMSARHTGAITPPNLSYKTPPQTINVTQIGGASAAGWNVQVCEVNTNCAGTLDYIQLSKTSGSGTSSFTVSIKDSSTLPQSTGSAPIGVVLRVSETSAGTIASSPQYVQLWITIYPPTTATAAAFGQVDTPAQSATGVQGAIGVTGWVVDDVGVSNVKIYRNCLAAEPQANCQFGVVPGNPTQGIVFIGDAAFVAGARPDVEAAFQTYPMANQAGWGYLMLTNMLPRTTGTFAGYGGQGPLTLYVLATDVDGNVTLLGRTSADHTPTSITMDNDSIAKPFGAIDTPSQGGTTSATFANFGWALTPDSDTTAGSGDILVPTNGSTMVVFIDGVPVANVSYNQCRGTVGNPVPGGVYCNDDVANIFGNPTPQAPLTTRTSNPTRHRNLDAGRGAIGAYTIDTTVYANGLHSIAWSVTDSAGRIEGIGSRNFVVVNGVSLTEGDVASHTNPVGPDVGKRLADVEPLERLDAVAARTGWAANAQMTLAGIAAGRSHIVANEQERVELELPATISDFSWEGYLVRGDRLAPLPGGSLLDASKGRFTWQTVAGYIGDYDLLFVRKNADGSRQRLPVRVTFTPKFAGEAYRLQPPAPAVAWAPAAF